MNDAEPVRGEFAAVGRREISIVRGEGARLWDDRGRSFVDLGISLGVGNLGHSNPAIVDAIETQARQLIHVGSACDTPPRHDFVQRLLELMPPTLDRVFLS
ncbi:Aminotransferase class-III, partial [mine drainage metagenome]